MSSTNRGRGRVDRDFYPTPAWAVHRLLDAIGGSLLPFWNDDAIWLEPCVGDGALVAAVDDWAIANGYEQPRWILNDIEPRLPEGVSCYREDYIDPTVVFRTLTQVDAIDVAITNPPFSLCDEIVEAMLFDANDVIVLQRLAWLAGDKRANWWRSRPFSVYVLPNRPSFTMNGATDSTDYAWFYFPNDPWKGGRVAVLDTTPLDVRRPKGCAL